MKLYRYEHPEVATLTPYGCDDRVLDELYDILGNWRAEYIESICSRIAMKHSLGEFHANARYAVKGFESGTHYSACVSRASLRKWFKGYNEELLDLGFRIAVYEIPEKCVLHDYEGNQVAFDMTKATFKRYRK